MDGEGLFFHNVTSPAGKTITVPIALQKHQTAANAACFAVAP